MLGEVILNVADYCAIWFSLEAQEIGVEAARKPIVCCVLDQDGLQDGLRDIDMTAWTCSIIVALVNVLSTVSLG
jgi:hypothetical protein